MELFDRPVSYDPSTDATVRVKAGEVRKRLSIYYAGPGGKDEVRIDLPSGGYVPEFTWTKPIETTPPSLPLPNSAKTSSQWLAAAAVAVLLAGAAYAVLNSRSSGSALNRFWGPALRGSMPILLLVSQVPVYGLDPKVEEEARTPASASDFVLLRRHFVGSGDVLAVGRLASLFGSMSRGYRVRLGDDVSFHDLRDSPSVLIGYSYTRWQELNRGLRYLFDTSQRLPAVTDNGRRTDWVLRTLKPDRSTDTDYAIVSRIFHPDTGQMVVVIAGITHYGTEAAAEFVTEEQKLSAALNKLPSGWASRNLQIVLHVRVISGAPGSPQPVATHSW
jgi:hypothetical protein